MSSSKILLYKNKWKQTLMRRTLTHTHTKIERNSNKHLEEEKNFNLIQLTYNF